MRSLRHARQIAPTAGAWINPSTFAQLLPRGQIPRSTLALRIRGMRTADIRTLLPVDAKPAQVFDGRLPILRAAALWIKILVAQYHHALLLAALFVRRPEGLRMTKMQISSGGGCNATAICHGLSVCQRIDWGGRIEARDALRPTLKNRGILLISLRQISSFSGFIPLWLHAAILKILHAARER